MLLAAEQLLLYRDVELSALNELKEDSVAICLEIGLGQVMTSHIYKGSSGEQRIKYMSTFTHMMHVDKLSLLHIATFLMSTSRIQKIQS